MDASSSSQYSGSSAGASTGSESDISSSHEVVSLIDRLKSPSPANIARLRKTKTNKSPRGRQKCRGALVSDPKGIFPSQ